ncbi:MAG TPA: zinc ribbon domain-containing protein [Thermomicrobiales bacterium]|nr:zinc ribbon domain-containing protein [Thermomicrobiales bacterium]HRA46622.1 zinc ribbon domain-containing protein [Thermomicrobiales bacterium]
MPTYQYQCDTCGNGFEQFQKFSEDPLTECPSCGGTIRRVIGPVGVVFKGSGWYINDSRPKASDTAGNAVPAATKTDKSSPDTKPDTKAESKSEPKAESKTEPKAETKPTPPAAAAS